MALCVEDVLWFFGVVTRCCGYWCCESRCSHGSCCGRRLNCRGDDDRCKAGFHGIGSTESFGGQNVRIPGVVGAYQGRMCLKDISKPLLS